jgi:hypothetical protein
LRKIAGVGVFAAILVLGGAGFGTPAKAMNVCGINGCGPVLVKRVQKPPPTFTAKAVPLVVSNAPAPAPVQAPARPVLPGLPSLPAAPWPLSLLQQK